MLSALLELAWNLTKRRNYLKSGFHKASFLMFFPATGALAPSELVKDKVLTISICVERELPPSSLEVLKPFTHSLKLSGRWEP